MVWWGWNWTKYFIFFFFFKQLQGYVELLAEDQKCKFL